MNPTLSNIIERIRERSFRGYTIKMLLSLLIVGVYFTAWKEVRGFVTQNTVIPILEHAKGNCNDSFYYSKFKDTSTHIHIYDYDLEEYQTYAYTTPAGFFFLVGLLFILFLNGTSFHFKLLFYFHIPFWILSIPLIWIGMCYNLFFFHLVLVGTRYFTQFYTFIILALLISPDFKNLLTE